MHLSSHRGVPNCVVIASYTRGVLASRVYEPACLQGPVNLPVHRITDMFGEVIVTVDAIAYYAGQS